MTSSLQRSSSRSMPRSPSQRRRTIPGCGARLLSHDRPQEPFGTGDDAEGGLITAARQACSGRRLGVSTKEPDGMAEEFIQRGGKPGVQGLSGFHMRASPNAMIVHGILAPPTLPG